MVNTFLFYFFPGANVHEKSRADVCRSRFKADGYSRQYAYSQHTGLPGGLIYDSSKTSFFHQSLVCKNMYLFREYVGRKNEVIL